MNFRRFPIILSTSLVALNLMAPVHADQNSADSTRQQIQSFDYAGFRSHGSPIELSALSQAAATPTPSGDATTNSNPTADLSNGDRNWLATIIAHLATPTVQGKYLATGAPALNPISCHNSCAMLTGTISLIPVWVGNWAAPDVAKWNSVLGNIVTSLGKGPANSIALAGHVFNTDTLYFKSRGLTPPSLQWVPNTSVTAPTATSVTDAAAAGYINTFIAANPKIVPAGTSPVYIYVGASSTLLTSGFGTSYCGWHSYGNVTSAGVKIPFIAFQNFTSTYNSACAPQTTSPNGSVSLDAMASVMVHEVDETLTDPYLNAWYDSTGAENADKCAHTYGVSSTLGAAHYNVQLGSLYYLIQQNWLENNIVTSTGNSSGTACSVTG